MVIYPLTPAERTTVMWAQWIVPAVAVSVILFLGWMSVASAVA